MPRAAAARPTRLPIRPAPMMPSVAPAMKRPNIWPRALWNGGGLHGPVIGQ